MRQYALSARDVNVLLSVNEELSDDDGDIVRYFEQLAHASQSPQLAVNWTIHELLGQFAQSQMAFRESAVSVQRMHELLTLIQTNEVTSTAAKKVLAGMFADRERRAGEILDHLDLRMLSAEALDGVVQRTIEELPDESHKASQGNSKVVRKLIGHAMKVAGGKADGSRVEQKLRERLGVSIQ